MFEDREWYQDLVGATIGGAVSGFAGGLGGIMFGNAVSVSLNYMEANICGREYSDSEAATDFVRNVFLDVGVGKITGSIIDADTNKVLLFDNDNSKFGNSFKKSIINKNQINDINLVISHVSTVVDAAAKNVVS